MQTVGMSFNPATQTREGYETAPENVGAACCQVDSSEPLIEDNLGPILTSDLFSQTNLHHLANKD